MKTKAKAKARTKEKVKRSVVPRGLLRSRRTIRIGMAMVAKVPTISSRRVIGMPTSAMTQDGATTTA